MKCSQCANTILPHSITQLQDYKFILLLGSYCEECALRKLSFAVRQIEENFDPSVNSYSHLSVPMLEHIDYNIENGLFVFTKWYHIRRGYCCGNGCRNCAYQS